MSKSVKKVSAVRFLEYVKMLPHEWIFTHLISDAPSSRRILSSAMIGESAAKFALPKNLTKRFNALPTELRAQCAYVYLMGENGLCLDAAQVCGHEPILTSLLVYAAHSDANRDAIRLFRFEEFAEILRPMFAETLINTCKLNGSPQLADAPFIRPLNDVAVVCSLAFARQLTRSIHGGLTRKSINALKKLTHDPTHTGKGKTSDAHGHPAGFLIGYCLHEGLIFCDDEEYYLCEEKFYAWLKDSAKNNLQKLTLYYNEFSGGIDVLLVREIFSRINFCKEQLVLAISENDKARLERALSVFEFFGRVDLSYNDVTDECENEACRETIVMSDFSVLIPQEVMPAELFAFSKVGVLLTFDKIYKGQISKESISNALASGVSFDVIREWLSSHNAPANVTKTIDEWMWEFSRLFITSDAALVSSDENVTRQIASIKQLREHLIPVPAHTVFMIHPKSVDLVYDMLEKLGFDTRAPNGIQIIENASDDNEAGQKEKPWLPLTDFSDSNEMKPQRAMERTKYGSGLKALDMSDTIHVVDYAILTNQKLVIDYAGNANIKKGIYIVAPSGIDKGMNPAVFAEVATMRGRQQFYIDKIKRIGVVAA